MKLAQVAFPTAFVGGFLAGVAGLGVPVPEAATTWTLYGLIFAVGVAVGTEPEAIARLRDRSPRLVLIPFAVLGASLAAGAGVAVAWSGLAVREGMAVAAGVGYYSLTSVLVGQQAGAALGVVALLANLLREALTLALAPWIARVGPAGPVAAGGATAMDTTLGVVAETAGRSWAIVAVYSGAVLTALVPVVVPLVAG